MANARACREGFGECPGSGDGEFLAHNGVPAVPAKVEQEPSTVRKKLSRASVALARYQLLDNFEGCGHVAFAARSPVPPGSL